MTHLRPRQIAQEGAADGDVLTYDTTTGEWGPAAPTGGGGSGHTIRDEGTPLTHRTGLNFVGAGVTVTDDAGNDETDVTIPGKHVIRDEGSALTARTSLDFVGAGVTVTDDSTNDKTVVTIPGGGGGGGGTTPAGAVYSITGPLVVNTGAHRLYNDSGTTRTIAKVRASCGTAPTGAAVIVDVHKGGTTIFTTQANRPTVAAGSNTATGTPAVTSWADGEYLTVDVDQIGTTVPGSDLVVQVVCS